MLHYAFLTFDSPGHVAGIVNLADKLLKIHPEIKATVYIVCSMELKWGTTKIADEPIPGLKAVKFRLQPDGCNSSAPFEYALNNPKVIAHDIVTAIKKDIHVRGIPLPFIVCGDHYASTWSYQVAQEMNAKSFIYMPTPILMWSVLRLIPEIKFDRKGVLEIPHYGSLDHLQLPQQWHTSNLLAEQCNLARLHDGMLINDQEETYHADYVTFIKNYLGNACFIGYLPPLDAQTNCEEKSTLFQWLDLQKPKSVIYIAVGTEASLGVADRVELAFALEQVGCPVVWSLKKPKPYRPIHAKEDYKEREPGVPVDEYGLPQGWRERMGERAMILEWVEQIGTLSHPATGLFISHCGWNSLSECISVAGIPILGLPMMTDQPMNGDMMEKRLKIGKLLWSSPAEGEVDRTHAANLIRQVMHNEEFINNAAELKKRNHERFAVGSGTSMKRLDDFFSKTK